MSAADQERLRGLLDADGNRDSPAYFALRPDKSVALSTTGKAAVTDRRARLVMRPRQPTLVQTALVPPDAEAAAGA